MIAGIKPGEAVINIVYRWGEGQAIIAHVIVVDTYRHNMYTNPDECLNRFLFQSFFSGLVALTHFQVGKAINFADTHEIPVLGRPVRRLNPPAYVLVLVP